MKILRFVLVLAVIGYAGWLAWPFIAPFLEGAAPGAASARAGAAVDASGGWMTPALWIGAVALYVIAALMLGSGNPKAVVAYFLGFAADAVLRLAIARGGSPATDSAQADILARSAEAAPAGLPVDPTWLVLGALLALGLLILIVSRRRRRVRTPGQFAA